MISAVSDNTPPRSLSFQPRVVAGILFSISKTLLGEVFPVYMGFNSVGSAADCDIRLQESTVSPRHALLRVVRNEETGTYTASFSDEGSDHGSSVNGLDARYETLSLNDGDTLDIGSHYRLLFRLFNSEGQQLFENEDFEDTSEPEQEEEKEKEEENPLDNLNRPLTMDFYAPSAKPDGNDRTILV